MKLKRIQIVELANGMKRLMVEGHGPMGVMDMCFERGAMMFNKALLRRLHSGRFYDASKPMDVVAMIVTSFAYGQTFEQGSHLQYSVKPSKADMIHIFSELAESNDLTDPLMTLKCRHMERYQQLFIHLYGSKLEERGVRLDD